MALDIHLPDQQMVQFNANDAIAEAIRKAGETTLTAYFKANVAKLPSDEPGKTAQDYIYQQFPENFVWQSLQKTWTTRQRDYQLGRVKMTNASQGERHWLRMLLTNIKGATSFEDLCTINGITHDTFHAAAVAKGLLADDSEHDTVFTECASYQMPRHLRATFATTLLYCAVKDPYALWLRHQDSLTEDYLRIARRESHHQHMPLCQDMIDAALLDVQDYLEEKGKSLCDFKGMPAVFANTRPTHTLILEQLAYDKVALAAEVEQTVQGLNYDQTTIFNKVMACVDSTTNSEEVFLQQNLPNKKLSQHSY
ncbi:MAG: hypothetical protein FRX49_08129 [Trebouxia sp. A1-2]|nr:MAG: hypothetical protein FRX49_08129 [Trebouxia sp. A1-2]